jgi:hypothetical protein
MDEIGTESVDTAHLWRLSEVVDAAREIPLEMQSSRLQQALARLVPVPVGCDEPATPEDPPHLH